MGLGLVATAFPFGPAGASGPSLSLSPGSGTAGQKVQVIGEGFQPKTRLQLTWDGTASGMPGVQVTGSGSFKTSIVVPSGATGPHTVGVAEATTKGARTA
jgi:hypothetical protein